MSMAVQLVRGGVVFKSSILGLPNSPYFHDSPLSLKNSLKNIPSKLLSLLLETPSLGLLSPAFSPMPSRTESRYTVSLHLPHPKICQPWCKNLEISPNQEKKNLLYHRVKTHSDTSCFHIVSLGSVGLRLGSQHPRPRKQVSTPFPGTHTCLCALNCWCS